MRSGSITLKENPGKLIVKESALLYEANLLNEVDKVILMYAQMTI